MKIKSKVCVCFTLIILLMIQQVLNLSFQTTYAKGKQLPMIKRVYLDNSSKTKLGEKLRFVAEAEGENLQYEWHIYKGEREVQVGNYSVNNYFEYNVNEVGIYRAEVQVKDGFSNISVKSSDNIEIAQEDSIKINSLTVNKKGPELVGTTLVLEANAEGKGLRYQWSVYKDSKEICKEEYREEKNFNYTVTEAGTYKIIVTVKDEYEKTISKESEEIKIVNPVEIDSVTVNKKGKQPVNTPLNFTVLAKGYKLNYRWHIYKDEKKVYEGTFNEKNTIQYTPKQPGMYKALVYALDGFGKYVYKYSETITIYSKSSSNIGNTLNGKPEELINKKGFSSKTKNFIWVDTSRNKVYIFEGKINEWKLIKTMMCTDGKASTPTVKGKFTINGRGPWLISHNPGVRAKYKVRFYKSYFFHSILVNPKGEIIDSRLGKSLSHGCIRLSIENAKWIYDNIKDGTGVFIN